MNHMRYYALFYPTQKMEHIKTLVYVLTGVMPRLQEVYYRQLMESKLPFEDLISGNADDVLRTKNVLQRHMVSPSLTLSCFLGYTTRKFGLFVLNLNYILVELQ